MQLRSSFGLQDDHSRVVCCRFLLECQLNSPCVCICENQHHHVICIYYLHGYGSKEKAKCDTSNGTHRNTKSSKCRVYNTINDRDENDLWSSLVFWKVFWFLQTTYQCNGINVLHDIIWHIACKHSACLRDEIVCHLRIAQPIDWKPAKDYTGTQSTLELVNKDIIIGNHDFGMGLGKIGWLGSFKVTCFGHCDIKQLASFHKHGTTRWILHITITTQQNC